MSRPLLAVCLLVLLSACVSQEPRQLVPSINLSPDHELFPGNDGSARQGGADFGFTVRELAEDQLDNVTELPGLQVESVSAGGPADMAGILPGDHILEIDGRSIDQADMIDAIALEIDEDRSLRVNVRRDTAVFTTVLSVSPQEHRRSEAVELYRLDPILLRAGFTTELLATSDDSRHSGARLVELLEDSPLPAAGLREDDVILAVNEQPTASAQALVSLLHRNYEPGDRISLHYLRDQQEYHSELTLWHPGRRLSRLSLWPLFVYESSLDPDRTRFTLLDLWLFSLFSYEREAGEREYSILGLFRTASGYGELLEE